MTVPSDYNHNPMTYDALLELSYEISGRYVAWAEAAKTQHEDEHWMREAMKLRREVREVDPYSRSSVENKRMELRERLAALPAEAPMLSA